MTPTPGRKRASRARKGAEAKAVLILPLIVFRTRALDFEQSIPVSADLICSEAHHPQRANVVKVSLPYQVQEATHDNPFAVVERVECLW